MALVAGRPARRRSKLDPGSRTFSEGPIANRDPIAGLGAMLTLPGTTSGYDLVPGAAWPGVLILFRTLAAEDLWGVWACWPGMACPCLAGILGTRWGWTCT